MIIFDYPRRTWSWADVRGTAPQFCAPKFMDTGSHGCSDRGVRFGRSTTRRRGDRPVAASRGPRPGASRAGWRLRQPHHRSRCSLQPGMTPVPITFLDRKIAARLLRRCRRPVEPRLMPDSYVSSMGSAVTETGYPPTADRDADRKLDPPAEESTAIACWSRWCDCRNRQPARDAPGWGPREVAAERLAVESSNARTEHWRSEQPWLPRP